MGIIQKSLLPTINRTTHLVTCCPAYFFRKL
jgi:hypothetical protein